MDYKCRTDLPGYHNDESLNYPSFEPVKLTVMEAWDEYPYKHELISDYLTENELTELADAMMLCDSDESARLRDKVYRMFSVILDNAEYETDKWAFENE